MGQKPLENYCVMGQKRPLIYCVMGQKKIILQKIIKRKHKGFSVVMNFDKKFLVQCQNFFCF
jgi:hypothetical protein